MRVHRTDLVSFAFGLLFLALAAWWLLAKLLGLVLPPIGWFLAGGLILIGGLGLIGALRSSRQNGGPATAGAPGTGQEASEPTGRDQEASELTGPEPAAGTDTEPHPVSRADADDDRTLDLSAGDDAAPPDRAGPAA
ncbi:hypothetical protein KIF24_03900 [Micromonospora sp. Llam7]|nr:hypothetical protein [Micromonospora tarapacensis]